MNERAAFLTAMVLVAGTTVAAFPVMTLIVILYVAWRAYVLLNPDNINHETAIVLRKATQFTTVFTVILVLVLLVVMSQSPIPPYIELNNMSTLDLSPEQLTFDPFAALMYIVTGRPSVYYYGGSVQGQDFPPTIWIEPLD